MHLNNALDKEAARIFAGGFLSSHAREIKILKTVDKLARLVYNHYVKKTLTERVALADMQSESGMV